MAEKRFYWIKLKDTFMTSDAVDFLMGQKNGAEYVVLYQMLCLRTINTDGVLARQIGEIIIPYDAAKIQRDCKYFTLDTVIVALELYKKLGLVYEQQDGHLKITNFENLIGSETASAARVRAFRGRERTENNNTDVLESALHCNDVCNKNVTIEKEIEKEIEKVSLLIISLKDRFRRAGVYKGAFDEEIDSGLETLADATLLPRPLKSIRAQYTG